VSDWRPDGLGCGGVERDFSGDVTVRISYRRGDGWGWRVYELGATVATGSSWFESRDDAALDWLGWLRGGPVAQVRDAA